MKADADLKRAFRKLDRVVDLPWWSSIYTYFETMRAQVPNSPTVILLPLLAEYINGGDAIKRLRKEAKQ